MTDNNETWLPNLVGGVSIWKLAVDLNEPKFMGGRLLVPETEGSESLPVTVRWDLTGLVPLADARAAHGADVDAAIAEFRSSLERVAKVFSTPNSGFDKYKQAFTVPSMDAGAASYFYSADQKKIFVINWGASPRSMGGRSEFVFGYEDWAKVGQGAAIATTGAALAGAAVAPAKDGEGPVASKEPKKDEKKDDEKKKEDDGKKRPWWIWPLFALIAILLVLLALFLLRACEEPKGTDADGGGDAKSEAAADGATDGAAADEAGSEAGADAAADANAEASADAGDAGADAAGDGGTDGGKDAGKDGGKDGGLASDDDDDDDPEVGGGGGGGGGGGKVIITMGGAGGGNSPTVKSGPHRRHYQPDAVKWRVVAGNDKVARTEQRGQRFDVWLGPNKTFQGVGVEWQDKSGKWHAH